MRRLQNQMIHDYIDDPSALHNGLHECHDFVPSLVKTATTIADELERRLFD